MEDFARQRLAVIATCQHCRREVTFDTARLIEHFRRRRMTTQLPWAGRYFVCRGTRDVVGCGHRGADLAPGPTPTDPLPPTPTHERVPPGVDRAAWARAGERERKRLIRRSRG